MIPAVSYMRMSKEIQDTSIPAQRNAIAAMATSGEYRILREYIDSGISGDATEKRVAFQRMLVDASKGEFQVILCWDQDRFGRFDLMEAGYWIKPLRDAGVRLVTVAQGAIDWNDFAGRLVYSIQQEGKHQFLRDLSRNSTRGRMESAKLGKWMGGAAPYGYQIGPDKFLVVDADESLIIQEIFRRYGHSESMRKIILSLTQRGIPSPDGVKWNAVGIGRIVRNRVYLGHTTFNKKSTGKYTTVVNGVVVPKANSKTVLNDESQWMVVSNTHEPIITQAEYDAAQKSLATNKKFSGPPTTYRVMCRSLLKCGYCGATLHGYYVPRMNDAVYSCSRFRQYQECQSNRTYQKPILTAILSQLRSIKLTAKAIAAMKADLVAELDTPQVAVSRNSLESQRDMKRKKLDKLKVRLTEVPRDMIGVVAQQIRDIEQEIAELEQQISAMDTPRRDCKSDVSRFVDERCEMIQDALALPYDEPSQAMSNLLRGLFSAVVVWSENSGPFLSQAGKWQPNGRWAISKLELRFHSPDFSR